MKERLQLVKKDLVEEFWGIKKSNLGGIYLPLEVIEENIKIKESLKKDPSTNKYMLIYLSGSSINYMTSRVDLGLDDKGIFLSESCLKQRSLPGYRLLRLDNNKIYFSPEGVVIEDDTEFWPSLHIRDILEIITLSMEFSNETLYYYWHLFGSINTKKDYFNLIKQEALSYFLTSIEDNQIFCQPYLSRIEVVNCK